MAVQKVRLTFCGCNDSQAKEAAASPIVRAVAIAIGIIALLVGILILGGTPGLSTLGTTGGWSVLTLGFLSFIAGISFRCILEKKASKSDEDSESSSSYETEPSTLFSSQESSEQTESSAEVSATNSADNNESEEASDDSIMSQLSVGLQQYVNKELSKLSMQPKSQHSTASFHTLKGKMVYALFMGGEQIPYFFDSSDKRSDTLRLNGL
jgi:hypothetical protein